MNVMPPYVFDVRIAEAGRKKFRIWFPAFLFWPLMLVLGVLALVVTIALDMVLLIFGSRYHHYTKLLLGSIQTVNEMRGLTIYVNDENTTVDVTVR